MAQADRRMKQEKNQRGGMRNFYLGLLGIGVIGGGAILWQALRPGAAPIPVDVTVTAADTAGFRGYVLGSETAPLEVTEYADYQCPACEAFETVQFPDIKARLIDSGKVRWRYRDFPLSQHAHARTAAHSAACADEQGKFWQQHASIYAGQMEWSGKGDAQPTFRKYAEQNGLDLDRYDACMTSARYAGRIQASVLEGNRIGVPATPSFVVNGKLYQGTITADVLAALADSVVAARSATP
ncbi:MAG: DsbA family protein [Gemmatimonadota bacterium]